MKLETPRLTLTTLKAKDWQLTLDFVLRNEARLTPLEPMRNPSYYTRSGQVRFLSMETAAYNAGMSLRLWMMPKGEKRVIGSVGLYHIHYGNFCSAMIGYRIDADYEGQGLMHEALTAVTDYAFTDLGLRRIEAAILPRNERSIALVKRCGFSQEGLMRQSMEINGAWENHVLFALLKDDIHR